MKSVTPSKAFWKDKRVVITGGNGFLGTHLIARLKLLNPKSIFIPAWGKFDLRRLEDCFKATKNADMVIHLAANVGGIGYNKEHPAELFDDNIIMGVNMMKAAREQDVEKYVAIGTICAYPKYTPVPFKEENLFKGYPEETNAPYGLAKLMQLVQSQAYRAQYGFNAVYLLPVNMYGPGDNFNPSSSHVIPALIKKFIEAKETNAKSVEVWGTGKPTREFLFVKDAANAITLAAEKYNKPDPVNIGSSSEISIKSLALLIKRLTGYGGKIVWDRSKPDGQPRRKLDITKARKEFGFQAVTSLETGLKETLEWYINKKTS